MAEPLISVIIATRDRADMLQTCLDSLAAQQFERDRFEVVAVDDGSRDRTPELLAREMDRRRMRLVAMRESGVGPSRARNAGIGRAAGSFFVFLDDDAIADPGLLRAYERAFMPGQMLVQGRILVRIVGAQPKWVDEQMLPYFGHLDAGLQPGRLQGNVHSTNLGAARKLLEAIGGFRADLGPGGAGMGEDTEFGMRAAAAGFHAFYAPDALAHHMISASRLTRAAFLRRRYMGGLSQPLFMHYGEPTLRMLLGLGHAALQRCVAAACADPPRRMRELGALAEHVGRVRQIIRMRRGA